MPKLKTRKCIAKRFKITKKKKVLKKTAGQDHFNAREKSKVTRKKRRQKPLSESNVKTVKKALPYHY